MDLSTVCTGDDVFDGRDLLRDANFDDQYLKSPHMELDAPAVSDRSTTLLPETSTNQGMDVDLPQLDDGFGGGFMGKWS